MSDQIPIKANLTSGAATSLAQFASGDTVPVANGGTGASDAAGARAALGLTLGPALHVRRTTAQSVTSGATTKVAFDSVVTDTGSAWSAVNNRFTPQVPGWYQVTGMVYFVGASTTSGAALLYKNGALELVGFEVTIPSGAGGGIGAPVSALVYMNGTTDYLELFGNTTASSPTFAATYTYAKILHLRA